ncbi:MAG TPA: VOC family protein [Acidimicrobiales bacterium]|nr:VOC family protein [Acidimicrobiales bacterium]
MSNFIQITPFMHVEDLEQAIAFFTDILGFETTFRLPGYAYVQRETVGIRIRESSRANGGLPGNRRFAYYVDVRDVDALYAELKPKLDTLPERDVHGPAHKEYGQRELLVVAPDGNLLAFGQMTSPQSSGGAQSGDRQGARPLSTWPPIGRRSYAGRRRRRRQTLRPARAG